MFSSSSPMMLYDRTQVRVDEIAIEGGARKTILVRRDGAQGDDAAPEAAVPVVDPLLGMRMFKGRSVVSLSRLLSRDEIDHLVRASVEAADRQRGGVRRRGAPEREAEEEELGAANRPRTASNRGPADRICVRMPTRAAANRQDLPDTGTADLYDPLSQDLSRFVEERVLRRTMAYIDAELPDVRETLFGGDCESLVDLFMKDQLEWSTREPAINVYYPPDGYFGIHKDQKALTILMPLTDASSTSSSSSNDENNNDNDNDKDHHFTGGGTAFWSQLYPNEHRHAPSLVLKPPAGTALLFGGQVSHKGLTVDSGVRVVFVASFSRKSNPQNPKSKTWLVSAR